MKTMTCKQLGGACDERFSAETFEEMEQLSKQHGMAMFARNDAAHLKAMHDIRAKMQDPEAIGAWMQARREEFDQLPDD